MINKLVLIICFFFVGCTHLNLPPEGDSFEKGGVIKSPMGYEEMIERRGY
jgi:hypothetical protein